MGGPGSGRKKKHGRPSKLTPEVQGEIVKLMRAGNYYETAAAAVGVATPTARRWLYEGANETTGKMRRFRDAIKEAEGFAEASGVARIRNFGGKTWQAEAWFLERRFPRKWGRWERADESTSDGKRKLRLTTTNMGKGEEGEE